MALKAYEAEKAMAEIAEVIMQNEERMAQALRAIATAKTGLDSMTTTYGPFISSLDAVAAANPGHVVWEQLKAQKDLFVAEFGELKTYATVLNTAASEVAKP